MLVGEFYFSQLSNGDFRGRGGFRLLFDRKANWQGQRRFLRADVGSLGDLEVGIFGGSASGFMVITGTKSAFFLPHFFFPFVVVKLNVIF